MIAGVTATLLLLAQPAAAPPTCGDWKALAEEAEQKPSSPYRPEDVVALFRKAAEAAECLQESPEVVDGLWLRYADWLSGVQPTEAVAFVEKRLQGIRS